MSAPRPDLVAAAALTAGGAVGVAAVLGLPLWPVLLVQGGMLIGAWPDRAGHDGRGIGLANAVTFGRSVLVGLMAAWAVVPPESMGLLVATAAVAFALDGVDGALARYTDRESRFGARLDMELDAVMVVVLGVALWRLGLAGPWVLLAGAWRYLFVLAGRVAPWLQAPLDDFRPRSWACGLCVGGLILALALQPPLAAVSAGAAVAVVSLSFLRDTAWLWRRRAAWAPDVLV